MKTNFEDKIQGTWKSKHKEIIEDVLKTINEFSDQYVLKGGTALMECYDLNRFSEDIDLDSIDHTSINTIIEKYVMSRGFEYRVAKNTDTVIRYMIDYGGQNEYGNKPLKVEISYRRTSIPEREITKINGFTVYNLDRLATMKANAYSSRDKIRDLYDLTFIINNKYNELNPFVIDIVRNSFENKGFEQFDYITNTQKDDLIDENELAIAYLKTFDRLGLLYSKESKKEEPSSLKDPQKNIFSDRFFIPKEIKNFNNDYKIERKYKEKNKDDDFSR